MSAPNPAGTTIAPLSVAQLADGCGNRKADRSHERFCFELFARAIRAQDNEAWSAIYRQYQQLIHRWVVDAAKSSENVGVQAVEDMMLESFSAFWRAYKVEQLAAASGLSSVMAYLKTCVVSTVGQARRKIDRSVVLSEWDEHAAVEAGAVLGESVEQILSDITERELWAEIEVACKDERDMLVARLGIVANLKPNRILALHPDEFASVRDIYDRRRNLRDRLQRNPQIQSLLGVA